MTNANIKMDVNDFIKACEIDDILIVMLLQKSRMRVSEVPYRTVHGVHTYDVCINKNDKINLI